MYFSSMCIDFVDIARRWATITLHRVARVCQRQPAFLVGDRPYLVRSRLSYAV